MFYTLHVVEPLRYDSVLVKETNEWMNEFVPWNIRSLDRSFPGRGTFLPGGGNIEPFLPFISFVHLSAELPGPLTKKEQRNKQKRRPMTATVHSRYTQTVDRRYSAFKPVQ